MLKLSILLLVLGPLLEASVPSSSLLVAKVNGEPIFEEDILKDSQISSRDEKINRAIQYRLIIQEAKKRGLERSSDVQSELNKILYKKFLETVRLAKNRDWNPTEADLQKYYEKFPLIRIRHLMLTNQTESEKQVAALALEKIQKEIQKDTPFDELCSQYSQDTSSLFGGDADFKGLHNFPEDTYKKIRALPKNKVSEPIELGNAIHLFQWFDKKPFTSAAAPYLQFLQARLQQEHELALLTDILKDLKSKAVIEIPTLAEIKP